MGDIPRTERQAARKVTNTSGGLRLPGDYHWVLAGTGTLADADAATLHALGDTNPSLSTLGAGAGTLRLWTCDDTSTTENEQTTYLFTGYVHRFPFVTGSRAARLRASGRRRRLRVWS
jgi:hypothetical protein